jgi:hypothetical protein
VGCRMAQIVRAAVPERPQPNVRGVPGDCLNY